MPVWWGTFLYMIVVSFFGTMLYKSKKEKALVSGKITNDFENYKSIGLVFSLLTFALLAFFVGQRSYIFDSSDYQYSYENYYTTDLSQISDIINGDFNVKDPGFSILLILFKHFTGGADYNAWFTLLAIIQCASIATFLYKYSVNYLLSVYIFFTSSCFLWLVNGIRQFLAVAFILFFVDWLKNRKTIPFLLVVLLAYTIHSSAILFVPVYFLVNMKCWSKKFIILSIALTVLLIYLSGSSFFEDTQYSYLVDSNNGVNPLRVLVMAVPSIIAFIKRNEIKEKTTPFVDMWINLSVITTECYIVGMFTNGVVGRIPVYFQLFNYLLLPWLLKNAFNEQDKKILTYACVVGFFAYFCFDMYIAGNGVYNSRNLNLAYAF
jgi:transmembrane protein EpsG